MIEDLEPFGRVRFAVDSSELTANYEAQEPGRLMRSWRIITYMTLPGSDESVEKPSVTVTVGLEARLGNPD